MSPTTKEASWSAGIQQLLLLGDNIGTRLQAVRPAPFDRRNGGKLGGGWKASRGGLTRFYCTTRGGEGSAPIDFIVQTLHAGGQLQQAQSNRGLRKLILDCSTCVWRYFMVLFPLKKSLEGLPQPFSQLFFCIFIPDFDYPPRF